MLDPMQIDYLMTVLEERADDAHTDISNRRDPDGLEDATNRYQNAVDMVNVLRAFLPDTW